MNSHVAQTLILQISCMRSFQSNLPWPSNSALPSTLQSKLHCNRQILQLIPVTKTAFSSSPHADKICALDSSMLCPNATEVWCYAVSGDDKHTVSALYVAPQSKACVQSVHRLYEASSVSPSIAWQLILIAAVELRGVPRSVSRADGNVLSRLLDEEAFICRCTSQRRMCWKSGSRTFTPLTWQMELSALPRSVVRPYGYVRSSLLDEEHLPVDV